MQRLGFGLMALALSLSLTAWGAPKKTAVATPAVLKTASDLRSFREWKGEKVKAASDQVERILSQIAARKGAPSRDLEQQLSQDQWNLEVARDLSVTDYLVLYLARKGSAAQLTEAARKLSAEETAQVLEAYLRSVGTQPTVSSLPPEASLIGR